MVGDVDAPPPQAGLGRRAFRSGVVSLGAQIVRAVVQIVSIVVLARILGPEAIGFVAMTTAVVGIADLLQGGGLARAAVQAPSVSRGQRTNLFWLNLLIGCVAGLAVFLCAPLVSTLYGEPKLEVITRWLALAFLFSGFAAQFSASLARAMRFKALAVATTSGSIAGLVVALAVAILGGSYWALVAQHLTVVGVTACVAVASAAWWPGLPKRGASVRRFLSFGANLFGVQFLKYLSQNVDTVVVGAQLGPTMAGLYSRSFQLVAYPVAQLNQPAGQVALPVLSRLNQDLEKYLHYLRRGQSLVLNGAVPLMCFTACFAIPIVGLVLGPQWAHAGPLVSILAVGGIFQSVSFASEWIFLSSGRTDAQLRCALVTRPIVVVAVLIGSLWGVVGVAGAYAAAVGVLWPVSLVWAGRAAGIPIWSLLTKPIQTILGYSVPALTATVVVQAMTIANDALAIVVGLTLMAAGIAVVAWLWPSFRADLMRLLSGVKSSIRRRRRGHATTGP